MERRKGWTNLCCFGDGFTEYFDLDVAVCGVECDGHVVGWLLAWPGLM